MPNNKKIAFVLLLTATCFFAQAQYTLNSPYSRYGYGDLNGAGFSFNRSLGNTGIAFREANTINLLNPASLNSQDSMSFIWDFGVIGNYKSSATSGGSSKMQNMNFDHVVFAFPVTKKYIISAGIMPYSKVGYNLTEKGLLSDSSTYTAKYLGSGNINQFHFGHSVGLLQKKLNLGVTLQYLFGALNNSNSVEFSDIAIGSSMNQQARISGWNANFGVQGVINTPADIKIILGAIYQTETNLTGEFIENVVNAQENTALIGDTVPNSSFSIPAKLGIGVSIQLKDNLLAGFDYTIQDWSNAKVPDNSKNMKMSNRMSGGLQYVYNKDSYRSYFERVRYRVGAFYESTPIEINGNGINDLGFTLGMGLPFKRSNTMFNLACELGQRGTLNNNLIRENYLRFTINVSLYDYWFIKRKYQ